MKYTILMQNNASKEFFIVSGLVNTSSTELYLQFESVDLPEGMKDGEYTYAVVKDEDSSLVFSPKTPILDTIVTKDGYNILLKFLCPLTGLLRVGKVEEKNKYDDSQNKTFYYEG